MGQPLLPKLFATGTTARRSPADSSFDQIRFGSMWRTAVGLGIIATISNAFSLADINPYYQDIVKGSIIVGALALDVSGRRLAGPARTMRRRRAPGSGAGRC